MSTTITPSLSVYPNRLEKAKEITAWLISIKAMRPAMEKGCVHIQKEGYPIDTGANGLVKYPDLLPFGKKINGVCVHAGKDDRFIFTSLKNFEHFDCPVCHAELNGRLEVSQWLEKKYSRLKCSTCGTESEIHDWRMEPPWSFCDLGFTFWNWRYFKDSFLDEFALRLGCPVRIVEQNN